MAKLLDDVHLDGLGAFRGELNPLYGAAIGGGIAGTTMLAARHVGGVKHPELIGFGLGAAATALMAFMPSTRGAAIGSAIGVALAAGLPLLGKLLGEATVPAAVVPPEVKGLGFPQARALNGLGYPTMRALNGLGMATMASVPHAEGAIPGVAGLGLGGPGSAPPVSLLGSPSPAAVNLLGVGGPHIHGLGAAYGATLLGAGR